MGPARQSHLQPCAAPFFVPVPPESLLNVVKEAPPLPSCTSSIMSKLQRRQCMQIRARHGRRWASCRSGCTCRHAGPWRVERHGVACIRRHLGAWASWRSSRHTAVAAAVQLQREGRVLEDLGAQDYRRCKASSQERTPSTSTWPEQQSRSSGERYVTLRHRRSFVCETCI